MVSVFVAKSIRGCHPIFSSTPCNDDWFLVSLLDYYRYHCTDKHPHPAKYWRYAFEGKWGWKHSLTDFKTQSIKEYIELKKYVDQKNHYIFQVLLCIQRIFESYTHTCDVIQVIQQFIFNDYICNYKEYMLKNIQDTIQPICLPKLHPINPLQVFIGRCKQYGFLHTNTNTCIVSKELSFDELIKHCNVIPRPHVKHPYLYIHNRETFYFFIRCVHKVDITHYNNEYKTPLFLACNHNISGIENKKFYQNIPNSELFQQKSVIDCWCEDLFAW
uniref:Uncharacterized protein n=1 Tax=viral metagenome TaxID=1070528 RepID=A0A6C0KKZ4_9ZZZZ